MADSPILRPTAAGLYDNLEYWERLHRQNRGRLSAVGYAALGEGFNRVTYRLRRSAVRRLLRRHAVGSGLTVLEAAPGVGAYASLWRLLGAERWAGVDISEEAVACCRRAHGWGRFYRQDITRSEWPDDLAPDPGFRLVTAIDVLYHLVEDAAIEAALANLAARVAPGGWLLVSDVFVPRDLQIAAHVKRRSLATYAGALGPEMVLVDREPVFAILADPVSPPAQQPRDRALALAWRLIANLLLRAPEAVRSVLGTGVAGLAWPLDSVLRKTGAARGVNLELALFRRRNLCAG